MRHISPYPIPIYINYSNIGAELIQLLEGMSPNPNIYRGDIRNNQSSIYNLKAKYKSKCGYCERYCSIPEVEHHRPIGQVNNGCEIGAGYYWLAYEWTNLVASCKECNGRPNKGTRFPIRGIFKNQVPRLNGAFHIPSFRYNSEYLMAEEAQIIHPEFCEEPRDHFSFNFDGTINFHSNYGEISIDVYGLNREDLNLWRKKEYDRFKAVLDRIIERWLLNGMDGQTDIDFFNFLKDLYHETNDEYLEYTLFRKCMFYDFKTFFIRTLDPQIQDRVNSIFINLLESI